MIRIILIISIFLVSAFAIKINQNSITCTVDQNPGNNPDFTNLQDALDLCRIGYYPTLNITLIVRGLLTAQNLSFPIDNIQSLNITGFSQNPAETILQGDSYYVNPLLSSTNTMLYFSYLTFDLNQTDLYKNYQAAVSANNNTNVTIPVPYFPSLFAPKLRNNNVTINNCIFENFYGEYVIDQESCVDDTIFSYRNSNFSDHSMTGNAFRLLGMAAVDFENNYYKYAGDNATWFIYIRWQDATTLPSKFNQNHHWRVVNCQENRCRYSVAGTFWELRCNAGQVQIFDRAATQAQGVCPISTFDLYDIGLNQTITVTDYELQCRIYETPQCNFIQVLNITTGIIQSFQVGNIVLGPIDNNPLYPGISANIPNVVLPCLPSPGFSEKSSTDLTFVSMTTPPLFGIIPSVSGMELMDQIWSSQEIFELGIISPQTCNCTGLVEASYDATTERCEYIVDTQQQMFCELGVDYCCADKEIDAYGIQIIYKDQCYLYPNDSVPAISNGSRVITLVPNQSQTYYDCAYEYDCEHFQNGFQFNCSTGRCYLSKCRLGIDYPLAHPCYRQLGMGYPNTNCNNFTANPNSTDPLCLFLRNNCTQYFVGNYLNSDNYVFIEDWCTIYAFEVGLQHLTTSGYFTTAYEECLANFTNPPVSLNGKIYIPSACDFNLDDCVFNFNDDRCFCLFPDLNCTVNSCNLNVSYSSNDLCYYQLGLNTQDQNCANLSLTVNTTICNWARQDCDKYYNLNNGELLPGYVFYNSSFSGITANGENSATLPYSGFIVIPEICNFDVSDCKFSGAANPLCSCSTSSRTGLISPTEIQAVLLSYPFGKPPENDLPVFVQYDLNVTSLNCATNLWISCNCTEQYYEPNITLCLPLDQPSNCTFQSINVSQCAAQNLSICQFLPSNLFGAFDNTTNTTVTNGTYPVQINNYTLFCDGKTNKLSCDCSADFFASKFPPRNGSITYYFGNLPRYMTSFEIIDNSGCYHETAFQIQQVDDIQLITNNSILPPLPFDKYSVLREIYRQDNEFMNGTVNDYRYNPEQSPYQIIFNSLFLEAFIAPVSKDEYECVLDASATPEVPGYGKNVFSSLYEIVYNINKNKVCSTNRTVLVTSNGGPFHEPADNNIDNQPPQSSSSSNNKKSGLILEFTSKCNGFIFASLDGAVIIGNGYEIDVDTGFLAFFGITFIHPGDTTVPIFTLKYNTLGAVEQLYFHNCMFLGLGARASSIIDDYSVSNIALRYCFTSNFNFATIRILALQTVTLEYNVFYRCTGSVLFFRFSQGMQINNNQLIECSGGTSKIGNAIITLRATSSQTCTWKQINSTSINCQMIGADLIGFWNCIFGKSSCSNGLSGSTCQSPKVKDGYRLSSNNVNMGCALTRNIIYRDPTGTDYQDVCFLISGGSITSDNITDNFCNKAQYGLKTMFTYSISRLDLPLLLSTNPGVRPTLTRAIPDFYTPIGYDFSGVGISSDFEFWFEYLNEFFIWSCNFGIYSGEQYACYPPFVELFKNGEYPCTVNNNYDVEIMPSYEEGVPRYGFYQYRNGSQARLYCEPWQQYSDQYYQVTTGEYMQFIYYTNFNGSRYHLDNVSGVVDFWLQANTSADWCKVEDDYRPVVRGQGHTIASIRGYISDLRFEMEESIAGQDIWSTQDASSTDLPHDVRFYNVIIDGRNLDPHGTMHAINVNLGTVSVVDPNVDNPLNNAYPSYSESYFMMWNCSIQNFRYFQDIVVDPVTGARQISTDFPYTDGVYVNFVNTLFANTTANITYCNISNVDRQGYELYNMGNLTFCHNNGWNCSGNSEGNTACVYLQGDEYHDSRIPGMWPSYWIVENNNFTSNRSLNYPTGINFANPIYVATYWLSTLSDSSTLCFKNNTCWGLPVGLRIQLIKYSNPNGTLVSCLSPGNKVYFPDYARSLRALLNESQCWVTFPGGYGGINGTLHDAVYTYNSTALEAQDGAIVCDECCPLSTPTNCYVDQYPANPLFNQDNPWFGRFIFNDPCTCINHCGALTRTCIILGTDDVFLALYPDPMPYKNYKLNLNCTIEPNLINQVPLTGNKTLLYNVSGNPVLQGSTGMQITGCGHYIDNPLHIPFTVKAIYFVDTGGCSSTWDFTNKALTTDEITITGTVWDGSMSVSSVPIIGYFDGKFALTSSLMTNYSGAGATFYGKSCNTSQLTLSHNVFENFKGYAANVYYFQNVYESGNNFIHCGGLLPGSIAAVTVEMCSIIAPRTKGTLSFTGNSISGNLGVDCSTGPFQTAFYLINVNQQHDSITITDNSADYALCVGLRFYNWSPFVCKTTDPDQYIRQWWIDRNNNIKSATGLDIVVGPPTATNDNELLADMTANPHNLALQCLYCENGCLRPTYDTMAWYILYIVLPIIVIYLLCFLCCPGWCFCVPSYCYDHGWHYDNFLGVSIPNNRNEWPLYDVKRFESPEGNNMPYNSAANTLYQRKMLDFRQQQGTSIWGNAPEAAQQPPY